MSKVPKREFWVTNTSLRRDVSIDDLAILIPHGQSRNLLDARYFRCTVEELEHSQKSGSLFAKRDVLKVRDVPPTPAVMPGKYTTKGKRLISQVRSPAVKIEYKKFDDLDFLDEREAEEKFALADAELAFDDHRPATLVVDKKYTDGEK